MSPWASARVVRTDPAPRHCGARRSEARAARGAGDGLGNRPESLATLHLLDLVLRIDDGETDAAERVVSELLDASSSTRTRALGSLARGFLFVADAIRTGDAAAGERAAGMLDLVPARSLLTTTGAWRREPRSARAIAPSERERRASLITVSLPHGPRILRTCQRGGRDEVWCCLAARSPGDRHPGVVPGEPHALTSHPAEGSSPKRRSTCSTIRSQRTPAKANASVVAMSSCWTRSSRRRRRARWSRVLTVSSGISRHVAVSATDISSTARSTNTVRNESGSESMACRGWRGPRPGCPSLWIVACP